MTNTSGTLPPKAGASHLAPLKPGGGLVPLSTASLIPSPRQPNVGTWPTGFQGATTSRSGSPCSVAPSTRQLRELFSTVCTSLHLPLTLPLMRPMFSPKIKFRLPSGMPQLPMVSACIHLPEQHLQPLSLTPSPPSTQRRSAPLSVPPQLA